MEWLEFDDGHQASGINLVCNPHGIHVFEVADEQNEFNVAFQLKLKRCGFIRLRNRWVVPASWESAAKVFVEFELDVVDCADRRFALEQFAYIPEATESAHVWRIDLTRFGYGSKFAGKRQNLIPLLVKLMETSRTTRIDGITCGGVPVSVERSMSRITRRRQTLWYAGNQDNEVAFQKPEHIENFIDSRSIVFAIRMTR
jgi:hypothetical protein